MELTINEFDIDREFAQFKQGEMPAVALIGTRNSGKTKTTIAIIRRIAHRFERAFLLCPTQNKYNRPYGDLFEESCVFPEPTEAVLEQIVAGQRKMLEGDSDCKDTDERRTNCLLVLDDCGSYETLMKSSAMKQLMTNGRSLNIFVVITAQCYNQLTCHTRCHLTHVWSFAETNPEMLKKLHMESFSMFHRVTDFIEAHQEFTCDHACLIGKRVPGSSNANDRVFYYRATTDEMKTDFRIKTITRPIPINNEDHYDEKKINIQTATIMESVTSTPAVIGNTPVVAEQPSIFVSSVVLEPTVIDVPVVAVPEQSWSSWFSSYLPF